MSISTFVTNTSIGKYPPAFSVIKIGTFVTNTPAFNGDAAFIRRFTVPRGG